MTQGSQIAQNIYALFPIFEEVLLFCIKTLIYSFWFYLILRLYDLATLKDPNPIGPPKAQRIP